MRVLYVVEYVESGMLKRFNYNSVQMARLHYNVVNDKTLASLYIEKEETGEVLIVLEGRKPIQMTGERDTI